MTKNRTRFSILAIAALVTLPAMAQYAYVTNQLDGTVVEFAINASTGALTPIGSPVPAGLHPSVVALDPTNRFAYVADLQGPLRNTRSILLLGR